MDPFITNKVIIDKGLLFGRDTQMEELLSCANRKENAGIIGPRRFGKTCLLKTLYSLLHDNNDSAYPFYFDSKAECIKHDTNKVYRRIVSKLVSQLFNDSLISESELTLDRKTILQVSSEWIDIEEQLETLSSERQKESLFKLSKFLSNQGRYVLLMFDEIDHLLLEALEIPSHFMRIRDFASEEDSLKFWIAGTTSWGKMCTGVGSGELNCGLQNVYVLPLDKDDFSLLWSHECSLIENTKIRERIELIKEEVYDKTGGVPFYAKSIGSYLIKQKEINNVPSYMVLHDHLESVISNRFLSSDEKNLLYYLSENDINADGNLPPDGLSVLITQGLVSLNNGVYQLSIGYLKDYLIASKPISTLSSISDVQVDSSKTSSKVDEIFRLREEVNRIWKDKELWKKDRSDGRNLEPFLPSTEDPKRIAILKKTCKDIGDYNAFSGALYLVYYEGSHGGANMPIGFNYKSRPWLSGDTPSEFMQMVHVNRHANGGHGNYTKLDNPMTPTDLYKIINNGQIPKDGDCRRMQQIMLDKCIEEMNRMLDYLKSR